MDDTVLGFTDSGLLATTRKKDTESMIHRLCIGTDTVVAGLIEKQADGMSQE